MVNPLCKTLSDPAGDREFLSGLLPAHAPVQRADTGLTPRYTARELPPHMLDKAPG